MPLPVMRIAPKPSRCTWRSPPMSNVPLCAAGESCSAMVRFFPLGKIAVGASFDILNHSHAGTVSVSLRRLHQAALTILLAVAVPGGLAAQHTADERAARALLAAGFPAKDVVITGPHPTRLNLVARLRGSRERPPILLLAHLDVVEARRE